MKKKLFDASMWKFLLVGVANTLLCLVLMELFGFLGYWPSTIIGNAAGTVMSFFLNRHFTFQSKEPLLSSAIRFLINSALCYVVGYSIAYFAGQPVIRLVLDWLGLPVEWTEFLTKLCGMVLYTCFNYFGQRFFAFRSLRKEKKPAQEGGSEA